MTEELKVATMPEKNAEPPIHSTPVSQGQQSPSGDPPRHRSRAARAVIWAAVLAVFALLFWVVLRLHQAQAAVPTGRAAALGGTASITVAKAKKGDIGVYLDAIGTVVPIYTDSVTSEVTGLVTAVNYREGQLVKQGDRLVQIDPRPFEAQLLEAQGALKRDTNLLAQAKMDQDRYQVAWNGDGIAKQTLDDQEKLVLQDEGTVEVDQGTVNYDQVQVSFCDIKAPISGRVGLRLVDPGNVVQANSTTPLVVITQLQPITIVFTIAEDSIGQVEEQLRQGKTLEVTAYDRANETKIATGKLQTIDNQIDTTTGTLRLRALFANSNNELFPNLFVNTKLLVKTLQNATLVPTSTIQQNGNTSYVYLIQNGVAHIRDVQTGVADSGVTEVEGVNPGDVVANSSFEKLQDNSKVAIVQNGQASSNNGSTTQ